MKRISAKSGFVGLLGCVLSLAALASYAYAKGGHGGGGHHGGGHHGSHHSAGHHSSHHHSSQHHHSSSHNGHHDHHGTHHHYHQHHHHYYHGGGWGGYGGWGWGGNFWGVPTGYAANAPYAVPYDASANVEANVNEIDEEDQPDDEADDSAEDNDDDSDDNAESDDDQYSDDDKTDLSAAPTADRGAIHVILPTENATVLFDGQKMLGMGKERWILTPKITAGDSAKYQVQAIWSADGKETHEVREGSIAAGQKAVADFTKPETSTPPQTTTAAGRKRLLSPFIATKAGSSASR